MKTLAHDMITASMFTLALMGCATAPDASDTDEAAQAIAQPDAVAKATCASGDVCIHAGTTKATSITNRYYTYGCYKLYDQHGSHMVENNQTGEAAVAFYTGSNCEISTLIEGWAAPYDFVENLERANSVKLYPQ